MIDKILGFNLTSYSQEKFENFQNEIINTKNARYMFLFAKYIKDADIKLLSKEILKTNDKRYIHFFIRTIPEINYETFIQKILQFQDPRLLFYVFYDTPSLPETEIIVIIKELLKLKNNEYLSKALYYYFNILNLNNNEIIDILKIFLSSINIDDKHIVDDDFKSILEKMKTSTLQNYPSPPEEYSNNCFKGRDNMIPDIIVCHITSNYEKAINTFYDEKSEVSSHFIVGEQGQFKQIIDLKDSAWANGTSIRQESDVYYKFATNNLIKNRKENANYYTFSIEHESLDGNLTKNQYNTTLEIIKTIIKFIKKEYNYDFIIDREHIIGHNEVDPIVRTICPGPKFPFDRLIEDLIKWGKQ